MNATIRTVFSALMTFMLLAPTGAQSAGQDDIFTVYDVPVDVTAGTAAIARDVAIRRAQRKASREVFARITLPEDRAQLPVLDDAHITRLVSAIDFSEERYSSKRYLANITITFNKDSIRDLVRVTGISFSQTQALPVVVVPLYREGPMEKLWEADNPWREAWRAQDWRGNLLPFVVPGGSLGDVAAISTRQAAAKEPARLEAIAQRYSAGETLVVDAALRYDTEHNAEALDVVITRYSQGVGQQLQATFLRDQQEDRPAFLAWCANQIADKLTGEWKRQTLIEFEKEDSLRARAPLRSLSDWLNLRQAFEKVGRIRRFELDSLSVEEAVVTIYYLGAPEQLSTALAQHNIGLSDGDLDWHLSIR